MTSAPTFSIITPSLNQARFIRECIDSVASQSHPPLEHIILDPGSSDDSREIASAAPTVTLVAERDKNQSDAICKGFSRAKGDILAWLNTDDYYPSDDVLKIVAERFSAPDRPDVVYGGANFVNEEREIQMQGYVNRDADSLLRSFQYQVGIIQPAVFIHRRVFETLGGPSIDFNYCMDYEYWVRIARAGFKWANVDACLAHHRWWAEMKTASNRGESLHEHCLTGILHFGYVHWKWIHRYADFLLSGSDGVISTGRTEDQSARSNKIAELYYKYHGGIRERLRLAETPAETGMTDTLADMRSHGVSLPLHFASFEDLSAADSDLAAYDPAPKTPVAWKTTSAASKLLGGCTRYRLQTGFDWLYRNDWLGETLQTGAARLRRRKLERKYGTCVIAGNGPSLNKTKIDEIYGCDLIISNFAYHSEDLLRKATYLTIVNDLVARQAASEINLLSASACKVLPFWLSQYIADDDQTIWLNALLSDNFSKSADKAINWRSTVSFFNLQLAYFLGYRNVLLIGFDNSYKQPAEVKEGDVINQTEDDENHFMKSYFKGKQWQAADTDNMAAVYELAKTAFEEDGRRIVNCTVGGQLEVFPRGKLADEIR
jgi:glycosyltransferase involved in cell wall biosynthesis